MICSFVRTMARMGMPPIGAGGASVKTSSQNRQGDVSGASGHVKTSGTQPESILEKSKISIFQLSEIHFSRISGYRIFPNLVDSWSASDLSGRASALRVS